MGAVPVQDANRLRSVNRATSPTSARVRAATTGPTPGSSIRVEPEARTISLSSLVRALIFFSTATSSAICSAASRRRTLPATSRGRTVARMVLAWPVVMFFLRLSRNEFGQQPVQPVGCLDPGLAQLVAPVGQHPQRLELHVVGQHPQAGGAHRDHGHGVRVVGVGLAVVAGVELACPRGQLRRHVHDGLTIGQQPLRQRPAGAVAALHRPHPLRVAGHVLSHRGVPGLVRGEAAGRQDRLLARRPPRSSPTACGDRPR